jgi:glycosyltransferase involved in cell wall biosynthesis
MCYTPIRYAWDLQHQYLEESGLNKGLKSWLVRWMLHKIRLWDSRSANGVDHFIAISHYIARRITKSYRRESTIIYPPVDTDYFDLPEGNAPKGDFYLTASRMVPYKKVALIVEAFKRMPDKQLIVIGDGPDMAKCQAAAGPNVQLLGIQSAASLKDHLQRAKAFIFAAEEDFGIAPIEAQACGTPVIAYGRGAATETIRATNESSSRDLGRASGLFFDQQTPEAIVKAVNDFETRADLFSPQNCRHNAQRFAKAEFRQNFETEVQARWAAFQQQACSVKP